jgi:hypothetical protein
MKILLSPVRTDQTLAVFKFGNTLDINGKLFDFSPMDEGDTLPMAAINSPWFAGDIEKVEGELVVTLLFPIPSYYSPEQAFPVPLESVPDGLVVFPKSLPEPAIENEVGA